MKLLLIWLHIRLHLIHMIHRYQEVQLIRNNLFYMK